MNYEKIVNFGSYLLPHYSLLIAIALVILPTLLALVLRYFLDNHLHGLTKEINKIILDVGTNKKIIIIDRIEQRIRIRYNDRRINTNTLIYSVYAQEFIDFWIFKIRCELIENYCQIIPKLLLVCGLLGTFLEIIVNLNSISQAIENIDVNNLEKLIQDLNKIFRGIGISFLIGIVAFCCSFLLSVFNLIWNTNLSKIELFNSLEDYIYNIHFPDSQFNTTTEAALENLTKNFETFLDRYVNIIEQTLETGLQKIEKNSIIFDRTATAIEKSKFVERLLSERNNDKIDRESVSELQQLTQDLKSTLDSLQLTTQQLSEIKEGIKFYWENKF
jgi:hypothetical protein